MGASRREQPWPIRVLHWVNAVLLAIMVGSGLQILVAYPHQGPQGARYRWYPFDGKDVPPWMRLGDWLAGARHWHFAFAWFFILTGVGYLIYLSASGEWRRRIFSGRRDASDAVRTVASYLRFRQPPPREGQLYNGLQRFAYSSVLLLAVIEVLTGLVLYKPVQFGALTAAFGGYDPARAIHWFAMVGFGAFVLAHVVMVLLHPRALASIFTGGRRE